MTKYTDAENRVIEFFVDYRRDQASVLDIMQCCRISRSTIYKMCDRGFLRKCSPGWFALEGSVWGDTMGD